MSYESLQSVESSEPPKEALQIRLKELKREPKEPYMDYLQRFSELAQSEPGQEISDGCWSMLRKRLSYRWTFEPVTTEDFTNYIQAKRRVPEGTKLTPEEQYAFCDKALSHRIAGINGNCLIMGFVGAMIGEDVAAIVQAEQWLHSKNRR